MFEICFMSIETDRERLTDTVGREKLIGEMTQLKGRPGENKKFFKSNIYGLCLLWDLIKYGSLMTTVTICYYMCKNLHEFPLIIS